MTDQKQKKHNVGKAGLNPMVAAVAGAVVGAGVAVAAVVLKDEKNREKIKEVLTNVKEETAGYIDDMKSRAHDAKGTAVKKFDEGKKEVKRVAQSVNDYVQKEVADVKKATHIN